MADDDRLPRQGGSEPEQGPHGLKPPPHSTFEDAQGILVGAVLVAAGIALLEHLGLVTGQTAGLALVIALATGLPFGPVFFLLNLPFYWLAWRGMGPAFTVKTFVAVGLIAALALAQPMLVSFGPVDPVAGAILAGILLATGLLAVFRHRASLGGTGILAVWLQDRSGFRAGWTQMITDAAIFALALAVLDWRAVLLSLLGAAVLNAIIAINHRRDRYIGY